MLAYDEQETLLMSMMAPSDTPHRSLLALLQRMAEQQRIGQIAEACGLYLKTFPHAENQLHQELAPILAQYYFAQQPGLSAEPFHQWCLATPHWAETINQGLSSPARFVDALKQISLQARKWAQAQHAP